MRWYGVKEEKQVVRRLIIGIVALILFLGCIGWLLFSFHSSSPHPSKVAKADKIHVAIVNEDSGSYYQRKVYHLGNDYLSQLKDTKNYDYVVVPRGVAENGIRKDDYQLVVYIPDNFSNKVMEINNPNPNKLDIQYKINASNEATKHQCEKIASSMIRDLNSRLTDVYTVGVMGNLYNAQNQVNDIYKRQGQLANQYKLHLADPIASYSESFPDLNQQTKTLNQSNQDVQKEISGTTLDGYTNSLDQIKTMNQSVSDLIKKQSETNHNQAEIVSQLLKVDQQMFDEETTQFLNAMDQQNQDIQQMITQQGETVYPSLKEDFLQYSQQYEDKVKQLNQQMDKNQKESQSRTQQLLADIRREYGTDKLTLGDVLKKQNSELFDDLQKQSRDVSSLQRLVNELPFTSLPENVPFSEETKKSIQGSLDQLDESLGSLNITFDGNEEEMAEYNHLQEEIKKLSDDLEKEQTKEIVISEMKQMKGAVFTVQLPKNFQLDLSQTDDLKIDKLSEDRYQIELLKDVSQLTLPVTYHLKDLNDQSSTIQVIYRSAIKPSHEKPGGESSSSSDYSSTSSTSQTSTSSSEAESQPTEMTVHIDIAPHFDHWNDFIKKREAVSKIEGEFVERYSQAEQLAGECLKAQENNAIPAVLSVDLDQSLCKLISKIENDNQNKEANLQTSLNQERDQIQQSKKDYVEKIDTNLKEMASLNKDIHSQMETLKKLQAKMGKLQKEVPTDTDSEDHTDELKSVSEDMTTLGNDVQSSRDQTNDNMTQFDEIHQQFSELDHTIQEVEKGNKGLKTQSGDLQKEFQTELSKSGNFSQSFVKVLNTAYKNGVPNEQLMAFISNPLKGKSDEIINEKTQSYDLTAWILVLSILSWFVAYIVQSIHYPKSYFSHLRTQRSEQMFKLLIQSLLAIVIGCGLAYLSQSQFPLEHSQRLWWYMSFVIIAWLMVLANYNLMHYLSLIGTGISLGLTLIYLMNAYKLIHLSSINLLAVFNQVLLDVLLNQADFFLSLLMVGVISILLILLPILIPGKRMTLKKVKDKES